MDKFKEELRNRNKLIGVVLVLVALVHVILRFFVSDLKDMSSGFLMGMFSGLCLLAVVYIFKSQHAIHDDVKLRELYINEHDERKQMIRQKTFQSSFVMGIVVLIGCMSVAVYFDYIIAMTLICVIYGLLIISVLVKFYYCRKY